MSDYRADYIFASDAVLSSITCFVYAFFGTFMCHKTTLTRLLKGQPYAILKIP